MARETTYLTTGFFFVVFTCSLAYCIRCFNCHLDPENGDCLNAGVLLNARQTFERTLQNKSEEEARLQVTDYIAICDTPMDKCVIESILTDGQYKLYYRDCSNGHNFSTDVTSSRLEATPADNNTHCTYISYIGSMLCVTLCQEDLCNGPALAGFQVRTTVPGITGKGQQSDAALRALALEEIHRRFPASKWTHVFTDGSAVEAIKDGGSGVLIQTPGKTPKALSTPCGAFCSSYRAEAIAIQTATDYLNALKDSPPKIVFLSDSLSVLQTLTTTPTEELTIKLHSSLCSLSRKAATVLQWIPAHCGISGNERADRLAREATKQKQSNTRQSFREAKTLIKHHWKTFFNNKCGGYQPYQDPIQHLCRTEQTIIFRLRTGHCGLKAHLKRIGVAESAQCDCGVADQTPQHILEACPLLSQLRKQIWPVGSTIGTQLWGTAKDLEKTALFATSSGLRI